MMTKNKGLGYFTICPGILIDCHSSIFFLPPVVNKSMNKITNIFQKYKCLKLHFLPF